MQPKKSTKLKFESLARKTTMERSVLQRVQKLGACVGSDKTAIKELSSAEVW